MKQMTFADAIFLYQSAVPRLDQKHRASGDAVRAIELVDGSSAFAIEGGEVRL